MPTLPGKARALAPKLAFGFPLEPLHILQCTEGKFGGIREQPACFCCREKAQADLPASNEEPPKGPQAPRPSSLPWQAQDERGLIALPSRGWKSEEAHALPLFSSWLPPYTADRQPLLAGSV